MGRLECILHGSFRKHFAEIKLTRELFEAAGIAVLAPRESEIMGYESGFARFAGQEKLDPRLVELQYLRQLRTLGPDGFSYFVNPGGYVGRSASYELGIAQTLGVPCFFAEPPRDLPAYVSRSAVWPADRLADRVSSSGELPRRLVRRDERALQRIWESLAAPDPVVSAGGIIEHHDPKSASGRDPELLFVRTHKWGGRYSIVGDRVRRGERLKRTLRRCVKAETGLDGRPGRHLCTFEQIEGSGYYQAAVRHLFVDYVVQVERKRVTLDDEAQAYAWLPAREALQDLPLEPNARHTVERYLATAPA